MGFSKPSKIQERALPLLLANPYVAPHAAKSVKLSITPQTTEHDRTVPIRYRKDSRVRVDHAQSCRLFQERATGESLAFILAYGWIPNQDATLKPVTQP